MKKIIVTAASALLLTSAGVGYAAYNTDTYEDDLFQEHVQVKENKADDVKSFDEYKTLEQVINLDELHHEVLEDNQQKRVILFSDNNEAKIKSIFVKETEKLKVIDFTRGLIFNQNIDYFNETTTGESNQHLEQSELEKLAEFAILNDQLQLDQLTAKIVKDQDEERIILFTNLKGKKQYKSIYVKHINRLKIVDFNDGILFNDIITHAEQNKAQEEKVTARPKQETAKKEEPIAQAAKQEPVKKEEPVAQTAKQETVKKEEPVAQAAKQETVKKEEQVTQAAKQETAPQQVESGMEAYTEYATIANKVNMSGLSTQVAEDNRGKRIILLKDNHGQVKYKSIFIKNKNHLKIIQTNGGLVYNGTI